VAPAARADADAVAAAAANSRLRVRGLGCRDYGERPWGARRGESEVTDGGEQERGVGRGQRGLDEERRDAGGEAAEELIGRRDGDAAGEDAEDEKRLYDSRCSSHGYQ
jgi:hypothetical protein